MFRVAVLALLALALAGCDVSESETDQTAETTQPATTESTTTEPETTEVSTTEPETPEPDPQPAGSVILKDRVGDPEDGNYKRYPNRRELDLRAVHLEQRGNDLKITFRTADPPAPGLIYTFDYYEVGDGSGGGLIQVRKREDGSLSADTNIGDEPVQQLDRGLINVQGASLTLLVPDNYLDDLATFRWRASVATIGTTIEVRDDAPNQPGSLDPKLARFP